MTGIWKYKHLLTLPPDLAPLSLGEGNTPLIKSSYIGPAMGLNHLYFKLETANPSGSYKDRFAALAIAGILAEKGKLCLATSSGNTGAALAAYAAKAGLSCKIAIVDGAAEGKLKQMRAYGAELYMVKGFGIDSKTTGEVFEKLAAIAKENNTLIQVSAFKYSPLGMRGVQSISYEIAEALPDLEHVFVPAGGGGLALAVATGFQVWEENFSGYKLPRTHCTQPKGNDTIAGNLRNGMEYAKSVSRSTTQIGGLQVANVIDGNETLKACRNSKGNGYLVSDRLAMVCQKLLASKEGIFAEPAGAVALAGWMQAMRYGEIKPSEKSLCIITGNGFKDPVSTDHMISKNPLRYLENLKDLEKYFTI